jgi:hypothetical protein
MNFAHAELLTGGMTTVATLAGSVVGARRWRLLSRGQRLVTAWLVASTLADVGAYVTGYLFHNSQPVAGIWAVVSVVLAVETVAAFHRGRTATRLLHASAVAYLVAWIVIVLRFDSLNNYSMLAIPLAGIVILAAGASALFQRVLRARGDLLADPAFLVAMVFCTIGVLDTFQTVLTRLWGEANSTRAAFYYIANNVVNLLLALILIAALRMPDGPDRTRYA